MIRRALSQLRKGSLLVLAVCVVGAVGMVGYARLHNFQLLSVQTGSMRPLIRPGDAVLVRPSMTGYRIGQIISYHSPDNPKLVITHRIVSLPTAGFVETKGDALNKADRPVGVAQIIGAVERTVPVAGYGLTALRTPYGLIALIYLPAFVIVVDELRRLKRHYDQQHYKLALYFD